MPVTMSTPESLTTAVRLSFCWVNVQAFVTLDLLHKSWDAPSHPRQLLYLGRPQIEQLAPQNWGTREFRFPPELGGEGGENRLLQEVYC